MSALPERSVRVSTLELFFDLVFVFTITQLTGVLVLGGDVASVVQVVGCCGCLVAVALAVEAAQAPAPQPSHVNGRPG